MPGMPVRGERLLRYVTAFCPHCHVENPERPLSEVRRLAGSLAEERARVCTEWSRSPRSWRASTPGWRAKGGGSTS